MLRLAKANERDSRARKAPDVKKPKMGAEAGI